jgi:hypothetical protein
MNEMNLHIMASIGVIATILTFVGVGVYFVSFWHNKDNGTGVKDLPRALGIARPGDVVILEVPGAISAEAHQRYMEALDGMNTGVKFVLLSDGVRLARVEADEP